MWSSLAPRLVAALLLLGLVTAGVRADDAPRPFDEKADAGAAIAALIADRHDQRRILLVFGANWCSDSLALTRHLAGPSLAPLLQKEFRVLLIDVGMFHRNLDITARYGNAIDQGIPAVALLSPDGTLLYVTHGQLSSAKRMRRTKIVAFFEQLAADGRVD